MLPDDDTKVGTIEAAEENNVESQTDHEESSKTDKSQRNYSLSSLTDKEKEQILEF